MQTKFLISLNFQEAFLDWERNEDPEEQDGKVLR